MLTLPHSSRLSLKAHFSFSFSHSRRFETSALLLYVSPLFLCHPHQAFVASRKVGNAVIRNRCKRLVKEAFRLSRHQFCMDRDMVFIVKKSLSSLSLEAVSTHVSDLLSKGCQSELRRR